MKTLLLRRFGQGGRLGIARFELIAMIRVNGRAESLYLPVAGHLDVTPLRGIHGRVGDIVRQLLVAVHEVEFPRAVQRTVIRTFLITAVQGRCAVLERHEVRTGFLPIHRHSLNVLPIRLLVAGIGSQHRGHKPCQANSPQQDLSPLLIVHNKLFLKLKNKDKCHVH